jgi:hypothetical protein
VATARAKPTRATVLRMRAPEEWFRTLVKLPEGPFRKPEPAAINYGRRVRSVERRGEGVSPVLRSASWLDKD